ncbi:hypothetical protein HanOQP8_Chr13g0466661 [Helianthus annuus]|nr:hypothetical protein HanOQP8_Chr13g0466661 [Helianthus annuus]
MTTYLGPERRVDGNNVKSFLSPTVGSWILGSVKFQFHHLQDFSFVYLHIFTVFVNHIRQCSLLPAFLKDKEQVPAFFRLRSIENSPPT